MIDKLELRNTSGPNTLVLDADAWVGYDLTKFWFKTDAERADGNTEEAEVQFLYSRAIAPFWDFQAGWRRDSKPKPTRELTISHSDLKVFLPINLMWMLTCLLANRRR